MKVYKSEPNEYGWYCVIHKNKDGSLKIFRKCIYKDRRKFEDGIQLWGDDLKVLRDALRSKNE